MSNNEMNDFEKNFDWASVEEAATIAEERFPEQNSMSLGGKAVSGTLEITVIRADGTVEPQGIVSYYHQNPWKQAKWESDKYGYLMPETEERLRQSVRDHAPKVGALLAGVGALAYLVIKNK